MMKDLRLLFLMLLELLCGSVSADDLLTGQVIGTEVSVDYSTNDRTTTVNTCKDAYDGDLNNFFAS